MLNNVVAVHEGRILRESLAKPFYYRGVGSCHAGRAVSDRLLSLMRERGYQARTRAEADFVNSIKEEHAFVTLDAAAARSEGGAKEVRIALPAGLELDGSHVDEAGGGRYVTLGDELFRCAEEVLFAPVLPEITQGDGVVAGLHEIAWQVVENSPAELRATLCANVIVAGGNVLPGLSARLEKELRALAAASSHGHAPSPLEVRVSTGGPAEPSLAAWVGASMLAASADFESLSMSSEEFDEIGPELVHTRCWSWNANGQRVGLS